MPGAIRQHVRTLLTAAMLVGMFAGCGADKSGSQAETFSKKVEARPAPDLSRLRKRSAPGLRGNDTTEAFYDILKLRTIGDAKAVPVLEGIMADNFRSYSTRIHGYAAAQALFCIDAPEAHKVLSKYLLDSRYYARLGINYTFHWEMAEPKRNEFINRYHLKDLSEDLALELKAETEGLGGEQQLHFTLTLRNTSDTPIEVRNRQVYKGEMLHFQDNKGRFSRTCTTVDYKLPMPSWLKLPPKATHQYEITVKVTRMEDWKRGYPKLFKDANLVLHTFDTACGIPRAGKFKVYAMFEEPPMTDAQKAKSEMDNPWSGRAVSKPIVIDIVAPPR